MESRNDRVITVAIIGAGEVGEKHALAFRQLAPAVRLSGIADTQEARATTLADACVTKPFRDYQKLLDTQPDLAVVCVPHHLHREVAEAAAQRGIHLLMEKPLAHTMEDARAIVDLAQRQGVGLSVSFVHRFRTEFQHARRLIELGKIGVPALALDRFCTGGGSRVPAWVWHQQFAGGGALMYTGIHSIDRLRWLLDSEVSEVFARKKTYSQKVDVEDGLVANLVFANGCIATLFENAPDYHVSTRTWESEIYGSLGRLQMRTNEFIEFTSDIEAYKLNVVRDDFFLAQAREVVDALRAGRPSWITGIDGLRAQEVVEAIYRSAESGQVEQLPEISPGQPVATVPKPA